MTENSKIEWCDATWQVTHGCKKVAAGCANCYAIRDAHRMAGHQNPKISEPRQGLTKWVHRSPNERAFIDWTGVVRTAPENLAIPLRWKKPKCIFVNSNSDLFHEAVPFEFIAAVYGVMAACPQHRFIILTKRPKRMREFMAWMAKGDNPRNPAAQRMFDAVSEVATALPGLNESEGDEGDACWRGVNRDWPLPNVIHGYSAANQHDLDAGIADLLATPSALRCLSLEPLIGPVDVSAWLGNEVIAYGQAGRVGTTDFEVRPPRLQWVITGGESGPGARPCDVAWIRSIVQQCKAAGVPCFVKQVGSVPGNSAADQSDDIEAVREPFHALNYRNGGSPVKDRKGADPSEWPADLRVREFPEVTRG